MKQIQTDNFSIHNGALRHFQTYNLSIKHLRAVTQRHGNNAGRASTPHFASPTIS